MRDQSQGQAATLSIQRNARHKRPNFKPRVCGKWPEIVRVAIIGAAESLLFLPSTPSTYQVGYWCVSLTFCLYPMMCFARGRMKDALVQGLSACVKSSSLLYNSLFGG